MFLKRRLNGKKTVSRKMTIKVQVSGNILEMEVLWAMGEMCGGESLRMPSTVDQQHP